MLIYNFEEVIVIFKGCVFLLLFAFLNFNTCSAETIKIQESVFVEDDDILDEFEDEFEDEESTYKPDPLNKYNRFMTSFNDNLYQHILTPVSDGYSYILNKDIRDSVDNFFDNLYFPPRVVNNLLQGKFNNASEETGRFIINSTVGILGFFDVAKSKFNLYEHREDFGQTLGFYGVDSGPHIVLPIFGPSNLRDTLGMIPDSYISPFDYTDRKWFTVTDTWTELGAVKSFEEINSFSLNKINYEKLKKDAIDLYPYLRDVYEQYRDKQIKE